MNCACRRSGTRNPWPRVILLLTALMLCSCAVRRPLPVSGDEQQDVRRRFEAFRQDAARCQDLEADALVTFRSLFFNGAISGILQARKSASLKFVGTNPLGQPLAVLAVDGVSFQYLEITEKTAWDGKVTAAAFREKAPPGVEPAALFSWLTGWATEEPEGPASVERNPGGAYWIAYPGGKDGRKEQFLYDPRQGVLLARELLDAEGSKLLEATYGGHQAGECRPPVRISLAPLTGGGSLEIALKNTSVNTGIAADEFQVFIPPSFERIHVE